MTEIIISSIITSLRSPSSFNLQPYRIVPIFSQTTKNSVAKHCLGRNADRVRDSQTVVLFLSDLYPTLPPHSTAFTAMLTNQKSQVLKTRALTSLFSGTISIFNNPFLTRHLSPILMLLPRLLVTLLNRLPLLPLLPNLPTLLPRRAWAIKNTALVASSFMLSLSSKHVANGPMEGYVAHRVLKEVGVKQRWRYDLTLMVAVGEPWEGEAVDDVGMQHGSKRGRERQSELGSERLPFDHTVIELGDRVV